MTTDTDKTMAGIGTWDLFPLEETAFTQAQQLSLGCRIPQKQNAIYRQALALAAFAEWLDYRAPRLSLNQEHCSVTQPDYGHLVEAVSFLQVGEFKICLLPNLMLTSPEWQLPKAVQDIPELAAHLYILVGIDEEQALATIQGVLRYDQLHDLTAGLSPDADWNYTLPVDAMAPTKAKDLLVYLHCLDPATIPLPVADGVVRLERAELTATLTRHQTDPVAFPWSWEHYAAILTDASLRAWVYDQLQQDPEAISPRQPLAQTVVDVRQWLTTQVEDLQQELAGWILPPPTLAFRFDDPVESLLTQIQAETGLTVPDTAGRAYRDVRGTVPGLRLYALTWMSASGWQLLLILGTTKHHPPAHGVTLTVQDATEIQWQAQLQPPKGYLYVQLSAPLDEGWTITVTPLEGAASTYALTCRS
ncbi:DUF1822 family protein (plasmid) [Acaryochloris sp. 'Moss Beach']|uniref:DUF1822 family protein n=1 Tax=Acaryochloris sp. 'Moss Beach' TaxID=2740837 RepID=UPI001F404290|nr:DUF1822 family protein [Acaryochloris sp. 'Moss Beach']UJB73017.1 DUF1822 family protein [Acaryochloris sp. 'Moss Beach']